MSARIVCLINQKGGCGKSSSCFHLAGALAAAEQSVLLVDTDPQGSLSQGFLGTEHFEQLASEATLAALFSEQCFESQTTQAICPTRFSNISMVPANQHLSAFNSTCPEKAGLMQFALRDFLHHHRRAYDWILIDCPPNLYQCTWNALLAADYVLIPTPPESFGMLGLRAVHQAIANASLLNDNLQCLGHLITRIDRRLLIHRDYERLLHTMYTEQVLNCAFPELTAFKVALDRQCPVEFDAPNTAAAEAMRAIAVEIAAHTLRLNPAMRMELAQ